MKKLAILALLFVFAPFAACAKTAPNPKVNSDFSGLSMAEIVSKNLTNENVPLSDINLVNRTDKELLNNYDFLCFYRDMDIFRSRSLRFDDADTILKEYHTQAVRKVSSPSGDTIYFAYETSEKTRFFIFFNSEDNFLFSRGFPVIMKETLQYRDFQNLKVGDYMADTAKIDKTAQLYQDAYDTVTEMSYQNVYVQGNESISTIHLLADGVLRIDYVREEIGKYKITNMYFSEDFVLPMLAGDVCYKIIAGDYF
jgi:hypothetical protein